MITIKFLTYFLIFTSLLIIETNASTNTYPWKQKLIVKDFTGKYKGWVEVFISTCDTKNCCSSLENFNSSTENLLKDNLEKFFVGNKDVVTYCATIVTDTDLPFWFFSGKSKTYEYEVYDKNFLPTASVFELSGEKENFKIITKKERENFNILWKSSKGLTKEKNLVVSENILTAGNLRNIIMSFNLTKKETKTLLLLDKFKLETRQVKITSVGKAEIINNKETYKINIDIGLFGKFSFYIDKDYNVVYGEGMGIKVFPER